jgi:hypothetical protein
MVVAILIPGASDVFMLKRGRKIKVNIKQMIPILKKIYVFKL